MKLLNWGKLNQLLKNAAIPATGSGIIFLLGFGFSWWTIPVAGLLGMAASLVISRPKTLALPPEKKKFAIDREVVYKELNR